jgi:hypothetical protein
MNTVEEKEILEIEKLKQDIALNMINMKRFEANHKKMMQDIQLSPKLYYIKLYGAWTATLALMLAVGKFVL